MKTWMVVSALVLASCARCKSASVVDAGAQVRNPTDLRTVLFTVFPEPRGTQVEEGEARIVRQYQGRGWQQPMKEVWTANGMALEEQGFSAKKAPFRASAEETPEGCVATVSVPMGAAEVEKVYGAPFGLSTEQLGLMLPKPSPQLPLLGERFELDLRYASDVAHMRIKQMAELLIRSGWQHDQLPPGWMGDKLPDAFALELREPATGARLAIERQEKNVILHYELQTLK